MHPVNGVRGLAAILAAPEHFLPRQLSARELLAILRSLADLHVTGADIVEVAPTSDHAEITGIAAAHVGYELLSAMAFGKAAAGD